jgi:hypothetical protein
MQAVPQTITLLHHRTLEMGNVSSIEGSSRSEEPVESQIDKTKQSLLDRHFGQINVQRARYGAAPLKQSSLLEFWAQMHADKLARDQSLAHSAHSQKELALRFHSPLVAENIQCGLSLGKIYREMVPNDDHSPDEIFTAPFTEMGIGVAQGEDEMTYVVHCLRGDCSEYESRTNNRHHFHMKKLNASSCFPFHPCLLAAIFLHCTTVEQD